MRAPGCENIRLESIDKRKFDKNLNQCWYYFLKIKPWQMYNSQKRYHWLDLLLKYHKLQLYYLASMNYPHLIIKPTISVPIKYKWNSFILPRYYSFSYLTSMNKYNDQCNHTHFLSSCLKKGWANTSSISILNSGFMSNSLRIKDLP